jgi:NitT/TauT family transport system ATP-binding protein
MVASRQARAEAGLLLSIEEQTACRVRFEHLDMVFDNGTHAIRDVSLSVRAGEFLSIVGPSGCGKSTLLRLASGLIEPSAGTVSVDDVTLGFVFQDATLMHWRNVAQNVDLLMELRGIPKAERAQRRRQAIELVGLTGFEKHYPNHLSGGMKMRASLARALTLEPEIFLFDEPFGALDEMTRERLNVELAAVFAARQFAAMFITHNIFEAVFMATRVIVMSGRPGTVLGEVEVPFGYPREPDLRFDPEYTRIAEHVSRILRGA